MINELRHELGLLLPKPYNLWMGHQTTIKRVGLIKTFKLFIYEISFMVTFTIMPLLDASYTMLNKPWLKDAKVSHDLVTIEVNIPNWNNYCYQASKNKCEVTPSTHVVWPLERNHGWRGGCNFCIWTPVHRVNKSFVPKYFIWIYSKNDLH